MMEVEGAITSNFQNGVNTDLPSLYATLQNTGCCKVCTLRFLGENEPQNYINPYGALKNKFVFPVEHAPKILKPNPCSACLDTLKPSFIDDTVDKVIEALNKENYDSETFNIALTLPISFYLRAHSFWFFLVSNFPFFCEVFHHNGVVVTGVKEAWKYIVIPKIEKSVNKQYNPISDLTISVELSYSSDYDESLSLLKMHPNIFGPQQKKNKEKKIIFSRKSVEPALKQTNIELLRKFYEIPPPIPITSATCKGITVQHNSIFFAGRYNKYSRTLSQTPWVLDGKRRLESSVQEIIAAPLEKLSKAEGNKFISSGREDVDVRMLGNGRPFALELINPHKTIFTFEELRHVEKMLNSKDVKIRDLQHIFKESLAMLKVGEESKTKNYNSYCIAWNVTPEQIHSLTTTKPLTLYQRTPVRVLHRRPAAVRERIIYWMTASVEKICEDTIYFKLLINTQAGTYVKEFVHGDFGRTTPNLGELLGNAKVDILALDVEEIGLNWPPQVRGANL
uniref:tRNA pseudouridine(55) synthase n=1 Tax=Clastoptera arizonana TaxID=38151 RepID=A0A1B6E3L2_9HEMI